MALFIDMLDIPILLNGVSLAIWGNEGQWCASLKTLNKWHTLNQVKVTMYMSLIKDK